MPFPTDPNTSWPPASYQPMLAKMAEWAAWYSGEPSRIMAAYATSTLSQGPVPWWRFWNRARAGLNGAQRAQLHVPVASDLAGVSGALLFGEAPRIRIPSARAQPDQAVAPSAAPSTPEEKSEARLLEIADRSDLYARLVDAAESAAAIGGVYIYPAWDKDIADHPFMAVAQADQALPEFTHGYLTAVTFWRDATTNGNQVIRHLERHEVQGEGDARHAVILHGLFRGNGSFLGNQMEFDQSVAGVIAPRIDLPIPFLDVRYVPNIRPNRLWRSSGQGVADIQGSESLLDALDETYASWMRDVRLAKARILVPREYLREDPEGTKGFDVDQEIYVPMDMEPSLSQDARAMLAHQFAIRHLEHKATADDIIEHIVSNAGYDPVTIGNEPRAGAVAAALRISEHKTLLTLKRKSSWWRAALADVLYGMALVDKAEFGADAVPMRPAVLTADSIIDSPLELAQTVLALKTAESASIETRVRIVHPDWSNTEVMAEVARLKDEAPADPTATTGAFGDPSQDPAGTSNKPRTLRSQTGA